MGKSWFATCLDRFARTALVAMLVVGCSGREAESSVDANAPASGPSVEKVLTAYRLRSEASSYLLVSWRTIDGTNTPKTAFSYMAPDKMHVTVDEEESYIVRDVMYERHGDRYTRVPMSAGAFKALARTGLDKDDFEAFRAAIKGVIKGYRKSVVGVPAQRYDVVMKDDAKPALTVWISDDGYPVLEEVTKIDDEKESVEVTHNWYTNFNSNAAFELPDESRVD